MKGKFVAVSQEARKSIEIWRLLNKLLPDNAVRELKILISHKKNFTFIKDSESQSWTKYINLIYQHIHRLVEVRKLAIK